MIIWRSGRGASIGGCGPLGCGTLLLVTLAVALLVYALSGGQCLLVVFP